MTFIIILRVKNVEAQSKKIKIKKETSAVMVYIHDSSNRLELLEISLLEEDDENDDLKIGEIVQIKNKYNGFKGMKGRVTDVTNKFFRR